MRKIKSFIKKETVLCVAGTFALASMLFVKPSIEYLEYIDFRTLCLLFCLMIIVAGLQKSGIFGQFAGVLLLKTGNTRQLCRVLIFLCFFLSMLITNDVALLTFVPLAIFTLKQAGHEELMIYTVVLQTVAANLGGILFPVGNPQNLYLYGCSSMHFFDFVLHMLPLWLLSLILIFSATLPVKKITLAVQPLLQKSKKSGLLYMFLFFLCLTAVIGWIPYYIILGTVTALVLAFDHSVFGKADYMLLLTFVCFFIFIGNIKSIPGISDALESLIRGRELATGILISQLISNVPAAVLLAGFTDNIKELLWAVNIGGLGTLIASLASLISYKEYTKIEGHSSKKYLVLFTAMNFGFLLILSVAGWLRFTV